MIRAVIFDYDQILYRYVVLRQKTLFALAAELRVSGIKTAVLTNRVKPLAIVTKILGSVDEFSPVIFCSDIGHRKPDPKAYSLILKQLALNPEQCLYVDNRQENIDSAKKLGMQTILGKKTKQTITDLKVLLEQK